MVTTTTNATGGPDKIEGGQYSGDILDGLGGNDTIIGYDGADMLIGNLGDDKLYAGAGDTDLDIVKGGDGNDTAYGGGGGDFMDGGAGDDVMGGGTGDDILLGETGAFSLDLYSAIEQVATGAGVGGGGLTLTPESDFFDTVDFSAIEILNYLNFGGYTIGLDDNYLNSFGRDQAGDDCLWGGSGKDFVLGSLGDDTIGGGTGNDTLVGGRDDDMVYSGDGDDDATGGDEDDVVHGGNGSDVLTGDGNVTSEAMHDFLDSDEGSEDLHERLDESALSLEIEHEEFGDNDGSNNGEQGDAGTGFSIVFSDNEGDDMIYGGADDDIIDGNGGSDTIWGGSGDDVMSAGVDKAGSLTPDNDTDILGFVSGHGDDDVFDFGVNEYPEAVNGSSGAENFATYEDILWFEGGSYNGEFGDAVSAGIITRDAGDNTVTIDSSGFGYEDGGTVTVHFDSTDEMYAFSGDNIVVGNDFLVSETASFMM